MVGGSGNQGIHQKLGADAVAKTLKVKSGQSIEELKARYEQLNEQKIKVETQRDEAVKRLNRLKAEALDKFGTDDLEKLKKKLTDMKSQNEKKRSQYQKKLDGIEQKLAEVNEDFVDADFDEFE